MTEELKHCPFCGGNGSYSNAGFGFIVKCMKCGSKTSIQESGKEAAKAWNSRSIENELSEKIEKLEAENTRLREALEFYANTDVYEYYDKYESTAIQNEGGQKAREALKEIEK